MHIYYIYINTHTHTQMYMSSHLFVPLLDLVLHLFDPLSGVPATHFRLEIPPRSIRVVPSKKEGRKCVKEGRKEKRKRE